MVFLCLVRKSSETLSHIGQIIDFYLIWNIQADQVPDLYDLLQQPMLPRGSRIVCMKYSSTCSPGWICITQILRSISPNGRFGSRPSRL